MVRCSKSLTYGTCLRRNPSHLGGFVSETMEDSDGNRMTVAEDARELRVSVPALYSVLVGQVPRCPCPFSQKRRAGAGRMLGGESRPPAI